MTNSDISDLHGIFPTPLRWSAEVGALGISVFDPGTGDRDVEPIELGSSQAKFAMDLSTRERGYGLIRVGLYDMRLTPLGTPAPEWPGDDDFKPAVGCWVWNPTFGELRLETNAAMFRTAVSGVWDQCRAFKEASEGLVPVIHFVGRTEQLVKSVGKMFWAPTIIISGWIPRDKTPFAVRPPTVKPPAAIDSQVRHALLDPPRPAPSGRRGKTKPGKPNRSTLEDFLDDRLPDDPVGDLGR